MTKKIFFDAAGVRKNCVLCNNSGLVSGESGDLECKISGIVNPCPTESCRFDNMFSGKDFKTLQTNSRSEAFL